MRYQIRKIRNGCWQYENENGVKTEHSDRAGAERMAMSQDNRDANGKPLCEYCNGEGTVNEDARDGDGNIMRGVGREVPCICQIKQ